MLSERGYVVEVQLDWKVWKTRKFVVLAISEKCHSKLFVNGKNEKENYHEIFRKGRLRLGPYKDRWH